MADGQSLVENIMKKAWMKTDNIVLLGDLNVLRSLTYKPKEEIHCLYFMRLMCKM